ncbi:MAG: PTPDL family protein [Verrucomicrobiota bacterium]
MKFASTALSLAIFGGLSAANLVSAAPVVLKDGTVLKGEFTLKDKTVLIGEVIRIDGDSYVIEYHRKPGIGEQRIVPKADIVKMVTDKPDAKAYEAIAKLTPTPDFLTADDYQQRIQAVKAFLLKFPKGSKVKEATEILKTLSDESAEVAAGGRKVDGLIIKAAEYRANAFDMDARILEGKIRKAAKNGQWLTALRAFAELDKEYQSAACYREVLPVVVNALQSLRGQVDASLKTFDARMDKRKAEIDALPPGERQNTQKAIDEDTAKLEKLYQREKAASQLWVTPNADFKQSLDDNLSLATSELQRLSTPPPAAAADGGKIFRHAWKVLHSEADAEEMTKELAVVEAAALPARYLKSLQDAAKASGLMPGEEK